jgi:hypothetical protein
LASRLPPQLWRAIVVAFGELAVITITVIVGATQVLKPWTAARRSKSINNSPSPALHYSLAAATVLAGLALIFLGAFAVRAVLVRRAREPASQNPFAKGE